MKLRKILYGFTLMLGCFVLASCVNEEEGPCLPNGQTKVLFTLKLQDNAQTRTDWGDDYERITGVGVDNYIDVTGLRVLIFDESGDYVGPLKDMMYTSKVTEETDGIYETKEYEYVGTAPDGLGTTENYKFVVLANCTNLPNFTVGDNGTTLDDLSTIAFTSSDGMIPMWGVTTAKLTLVAGERQNIGTLPLLRAMSKVTVKFSATATAEDLRGYNLEQVTVSNYNKKGFVVPAGYKTVGITTDLNIEENTFNPNTADGSAATDLPLSPTGNNEVTFYLAEYKNVGAEDPIVLNVKVSKTVEGETQPRTFEAPILFCEYKDGAPKAGATPYNIIRNHYYEFSIYRVSDAGELYVNPTVAPWTNAPELEYTINMSTNMRLFDSWLYRYDTDNKYAGKYTSFDHWAESHIAVSSERGIGIKDGDIVIEPAGRPLQSPQIQLVTTGTGTFELYVDNDDFEIVEAIKDGTGVVQRYNTSEDRITEDNPKGTLTIAAGVDVYTYFYIVPKAGVTTFANPVAKVFLYYNDPVLGKQEVPFNNNSLPGYSDDSSEIWAYYVTDAQYQAGKIGDNTFMKMYYQDVNNPIVPVNP